MTLTLIECTPRHLGGAFSIEGKVVIFIVALYLRHRQEYTQSSTTKNFGKVSF